MTLDQLVEHFEKASECTPPTSDGGACLGAYLHLRQLAEVRRIIQEAGMHVLADVFEDPEFQKFRETLRVAAGSPVVEEGPAQPAPRG